MDNLVKLAQHKDADAFTELMQSHMQSMYKTARAILHNDEDAADAISDTILVCWEKLGQLKQLTNMVILLIRTALLPKKMKMAA